MAKRTLSFLFSGVAVVSASYKEYKGTNCYHGHGGETVPGNPDPLPGLKTPAECRKICDTTPNCVAYIMPDVAGRERDQCFLRSSCEPEAYSGYNTWKKAMSEQGGGCPSTPPAKCRTMSDCKCLPSAGFHFYKCGNLWCNDQCEGCHTSVNASGVKCNPTVSPPERCPDLTPCPKCGTSMCECPGLSAPSGPMCNPTAKPIQLCPDGNPCPKCGAEFCHCGSSPSPPAPPAPTPTPPSPSGPMCNPTAKPIQLCPNGNPCPQCGAPACHCPAAKVQENTMVTGGGCPSTPPAACRAMSDCKCLPSAGFHFYKCGKLWCNDQCEGCHTSVNASVTVEDIVV